MKIGNSRRAFSFTEILFAVMIIAIGFIMIAAMFPVALKQTENSISDTAAAGIAKSGSTFLAEIAGTKFVSNFQPQVKGVPDQELCVLTPTVRITAGAKNAWGLWLKSNNPDKPFIDSFPMLGAPPLSTSQTIPGEVWPLDVAQSAPMMDDQVRLTRIINGATVTNVFPLFSGLVWPKASQNMIQTGNSKFAWVAFYKRDMMESVNSTGVYSFSYAPYAQVILVAVQSRNVDSFSVSDLTPSTGSLEPTKYSNVQLVAPNSAVSGSSPPDTTIIGGAVIPVTASNPNQTDRRAPGAFVVISADSLATNDPMHGQLNGHAFRLGNTFTGTANGWEFQPGFTLSAGDAKVLANMGGGVTFTVYMIGMGHDPNQAGNPFAGPAMDVAVYSTFVQCGAN